jgi:hypothetical protein
MFIANSYINEINKNKLELIWNNIYYHILTQDMFNFAYVINPKCNK